MKSTSMEVRPADLVTAREARFGRTIFAAIAALCLAISTTTIPASAQEAMAPLASPQATNTLPACGETLTQLSATGAQSVSIESGTEPGETDPMGTPAGRYMLFADDEVLGFQPLNSVVAAEVLATDNGSTNPGYKNWSIAPLDPSGWARQRCFR
jgi:hypothetical protein